MAVSSTTAENPIADELQYDKPRLVNFPASSDVSQQQMLLTLYEEVKRQKMEQAEHKKQLEETIKVLKDQKENHATEMEEQKKHLEGKIKILQDEHAAEMRKQQKLLDETNKRMQDQEEENRKQEKQLEDMKKEMTELKVELDAYKTFQSRYKEAGGDTLFYMDLGDAYENIKQQYNDDPEKMKDLEKWYAKQRRIGRVRVGVIIMSGAGVGAATGGLVLHAPVIAAACIAAGVALSPLGVIVIGMGAGALLVGTAIAAYLAYQKGKHDAMKGSATLVVDTKNVQLAVN